MARKKSQSSIKETAKKYRERNGNEKITNKELLWFMIGEFDELKTRVAKTETRQNMFIVLLPIAVGAAAIIVGLI